MESGCGRVSKMPKTDEPEPDIDAYNAPCLYRSSFTSFISRCFVKTLSSKSLKITFFQFVMGVFSILSYNDTLLL